MPRLDLYYRSTVQVTASRLASRVTVNSTVTAALVVVIQITPNAAFWVAVDAVIIAVPLTVIRTAPVTASFADLTSAAHGIPIATLVVVVVHAMGFMLVSCLQSRRPRQSVLPGAHPTAKTSHTLSCSLIMLVLLVVCMPDS